MARKRADSERTDISPELHARIVELSTLLWQGNRSKMARELGIDQPTISRVLSGDQKPSGKFFERLTNRSQVNVGWLFLGQGEPLTAPGTRPGVGGYRPLLDELLIGPLEDHRNDIVGVSYPVAAAFDTLTSYWYRVPPNSPVTISDYKVQAGDLMLMETDAGWTRRGTAVPGKFCGFRIRKGKKDVVGLGWVEAYSKTAPPFDAFEQYRVRMFQEPTEDVWLIVPTNSGGDEEAGPALSGKCLSLDRVACVCVRMERTFIKNSRRDN